MILLALFLAAEEIPEYGGGQCDAKPVQYLVGKLATKARISAAKKRSKANLVRKLADHGIITMEYMFGRLNIVTNKKNLIVRINCG